jgi:hypothetical protein
MTIPRGGEPEQLRSTELNYPLTVQVRRVATTATLDMRPRDVDFCVEKSDDAGDRENEEGPSKRLKRWLCWGIGPFLTWSGLA